jgi:hypothetical protein
MSVFGPNKVTTIDNTGNTGWDTSITIGADGLPIIAYDDYAYHYLKVAHCEDHACNTATITTVDTTYGIALPSISIGADGLPIISHTGDWDLMVVHCNDLACTSGVTTNLDTGYIGSSSMTIGADDLPVISYQDNMLGDLKVAHCNDAACTSATTSTIDSNGVVGGYSSITIGADGLPVISYIDSALTDLKVGHCNDIACTSATVYTLDSEGDVGYYTSITIGLDGLPIISYVAHSPYWDLKVAHCNNLSCSSATLTTLDAGELVDNYTSIAIASDGLPVISYKYNNPSDDLRFAHCSDVACTSATLMTLDSTGNVGSFSSLTVGADGLPIISYYGNPGLKIAHCGNVLCNPYIGRR